MGLWTAAEDETLKQLYAEEYSCAQIAAQLHGKTRNAVIGRVHRLGLPPRGSGTVPAKVERKPRERGPRKPKITIVRPPQETIQICCAAIEPLYRTFGELESDHCRWPYGAGVGTTYCGHGKRYGSSYCADHFFLSIGPGTASENAAHRVSRRKLEGAW